MQKSKTAMKNGIRQEERDSMDTLSVRGADVTWQAGFGMA
jgi:hypothetical protein